jgi:phosphoribosyl-ATP pyrophosphohydrolase/phosphoribosyl-AMP cyclohydrolase
MLFEHVNADSIKWGNDNLIPAIVQDYYTGRVLMLAYVNRESLNFMQEKGETCFWSRSRSELWHKGATSGNVQEIKSMALDCDNDTLLIQAVQIGGGACHTGDYSCFGNDDYAAYNIIQNDFETIKDRSANPKENSYTNYLLEKGVDKICKKVGEEAAEVIIAAKNDNGGLAEEIADLTYHLLVLMHEYGVAPKDIMEVLKQRSS